MLPAAFTRTLIIACVSALSFGCGSYLVLNLVHEAAWQTAYIIGIQIIVLAVALWLDTALEKKT